MDPNILAKVEILINQKRYEEADKLMGVLLSQDPENIYLLSKYSELLLGMNRFGEAKLMIDDAIRLAPDEDSFYFIKSRVLVRMEQYDLAEDCLRFAVELDSEDPDYLAFWGWIKVQRKQYQKGLDLANDALALDAEHLLALNARSTALQKLGNKADSFRTIEDALKEDPNNAFTHANFGWTLLEKGDHKKALEHFGEALKIDPNFEFAQAGMVQALKAKWFIYRWFLNYSFWISNLSSNYQWGFIIGFYLLSRFIRSSADALGPLKPVAYIVLALLAIFAISTWIIGPLSNLMFRLNKYGKHLLDKEELDNSTAVGIALLVFFIGLIAFFVLGGDAWLAVAIYGFTMMIPFSRMFSPSKPKKIFFIYAIGMTLLGALAIAFSFLDGKLVNGFSSLYLLGFIAFQFLANFISIRSSNL